MDVFALGLKIKEEGAATVEASLRKLNAAAVATGAALGVTLAAALKKTLDASAEAQFAQAQLAAAIRSTGGAAGQSISSLNEHAAALQRVSLFGDDAVNQAQSLLLTFTKIQGDTFPKATEAVLNVATAMGTDLKNAAIQVGKALNDPVLGVTALARSGIQFTEAQKDVIKSLVAAGQQAEAQRLILQELEVQFGGSAAAARDTLGGALTGLKNAFGDLFEVSQEGARPVIAAINGMESAVVGLGQALDYTRAAVVALGSAFVAMNARLIVSSVGAVINTVRALAGVLNLAKIAQYALNTAMAANPIGLVIAALGTLTAGLLVFAKRTKDAAEARDEEIKNSPQYVAALEIQRRRREALAAAMDVSRQSADQLATATDKLTQREKLLREALANRALTLRQRNEIEKDLNDVLAQQDAITRQLAERTKTAAEAEAERIANLIKLSELTTITNGELAAMVAADADLSAQLANGNLPLSDRVALLARQLELQNAIANAQTRSSAAAKEAAAAAQKRAAAAAGTTTQVVRTSDAMAAGLPGSLTSDALARFVAQGKADAQKAANELALTINDAFGKGVANGITDGLASGIAAAIGSGQIADAWRAMGQAIVQNMASAMVEVALAAIKFGTMLQKIQTFLVNNPAVAVAAAAAMLAFAYANGGKAKGTRQGVSGGIGGASFTPMVGVGQTAPTQLIFGATSATTAAGMTPRQAVNVTLIGPNDPTAQRAMQELLRNANQRGTLG